MIAQSKVSWSKIIAAVCIIVALIAAVCYWYYTTTTLPPPSTKLEPIRVGVIGPMAYTHGTAQVRGAMLAAEEINAAGGILGRRVDVYYRDTKLDPSIGITAATELVKDVGVHFLCGEFSSGVALALLPYLADFKVPFFYGPASPRICEEVGKNYDSYGKYAFQMGVQSVDCFAKDTVVSIKTWIEEYHYPIKKYAILRDDAIWALDGVNSTQKYIKEFGLDLEFVADIPVPLGTTTFEPIILDLEAKGVDVVVCWFAHVVDTPFVKQWRELKGDFLITGELCAMIDHGIWNKTGGDVEYACSIWSSGGVYDITPKMLDFNERYKAKFGTLPESFEVWATYDGIYAYKCAVEKAAKAGEKDPFDVETVIRYLEQIDKDHPLPVPRGNLAFTKDTHELVWGVDYILNPVFQWQGPLKEVVWSPHELATGEFKLPPWVTFHGKLKS